MSDPLSAEARLAKQQLLDELNKACDVLIQGKDAPAPKQRKILAAFLRCLLEIYRI